jgi:Fic family protein
MSGHVEAEPSYGGRAGRYVRQPGNYSAFIPEPLPPSPPLRFTTELVELLSAADLALGRLDGTALMLPNPDLFVGMYVRQEAVLSSQIEGTQASLTDVLQFEIEHGDERPRDVREVVNYVDAMNHGLERLPELPLSLRLIREIHAALLNGVRGHHREPGEFRRSQNWIGPAGATLRHATFVPPPAHEVPRSMASLERFWHAPEQSPLIKAALAHVQFETIHPFLDGNGRVGRLLITFMLCQEGVLRRPLLYLSHFLKRHRTDYYGCLQAVRDRGQWEEWLAFFLRGVREVASEATDTATSIVAMRELHRDRVGDERAGRNLQRVLDLLFQQPIITVPMVQRHLAVTYATANTLVRRLVELRVLQELTGQRRNRRFGYRAYLALFEPARSQGKGDGEATEG